MWAARRDTHKACAGGQEEGPAEDGGRRTLVGPEREEHDPSQEEKETPGERISGSSDSSLGGGQNAMSRAGTSRAAPQLVRGRDKL